MPECTGKDLQSARTRAEMTQWQAGNACGVSEHTIQRWESDSKDSQPKPDDVDRFAQAVGDPTLWHRWMISHYDSYRRRYIGGGNSAELSSLLSRLRLEMQDMQALYDSVERDALDGRIDDAPLKERCRKELQELIAAGSDLLQKLIGQ